MDESVGKAVLSAAELELDALFGERILALYVLGSLAHGGFAPLVSDVDVGMILESPLEEGDEGKFNEAVKKIRALELPLADRISIFWGSIESMNGVNGGRFPPLDRLDLIEHGTLLRGTDVRKSLVRPSHDDLVVLGADFAVTVLRNPENMKYLTDPVSLIAAGPRKLTKLVLFPVRFLHTLRTGEIGENEAAVSHYVQKTPDEKAKLAAAGFSWRTIAPTADAATLALLRLNLIPLYLEFMDEYRRRLIQLDQPALANSLAAWAAELSRPPRNEI